MKCRQSGCDKDATYELHLANESVTVCFEHLLSTSIAVAKKQDELISELYNLYTDGLDTHKTIVSLYDINQMLLVLRKVVASSPEICQARNEAAAIKITHDALNERRSN